MKIRASLLLLVVCAAFPAQTSAAIPPQPRARDVVQAFAQMKSEWTRVNGWNYKFQLLEQYYDGGDGVQHLTWCVTAARGTKKAFYAMEVLNGFDGQAFKMHDSISVTRTEQPCEGVRPGRFRTPKGGR